MTENDEGLHASTRKQGCEAHLEAREMVIRFFFPSELHDAMTFDQFCACMPPSLRSAVRADGDAIQSSSASGLHGLASAGCISDARQGVTDGKGDSGGLGKRGTGGRDGDFGQTDLVEALYASFLQHRRWARDSVRHSIDVHYPPSRDELLEMSDAELERHVDVLSQQIASAQESYDESLNCLRTLNSMLRTNAVDVNALRNIGCSSDGSADVPGVCRSIVDHGERVVSMLDASRK